MTANRWRTPALAARSPHSDSLVTTPNYDVVMATPRSVRLSDDVLRRLDQFATGRGSSVASAMERLLDEALRREAHPMITFRDGPSGRRAGLVAGPDVDEVIRILHAVQEVDGVDDRTVVGQVADASSIAPAQVHAAVAYYAAHRDEVDARMAENQRAADEHEAAWLRQQEILSGRSR